MTSAQSRPCFAAALLSLAFAFGQAAEESWEVRRQRLGNEDPYRILVDKVLSASNDWVMTPNPRLADLAKSAREVAGKDLIPFTTEPVPEAELSRVFTHRPRARYQVLLKKGERLKGELTALQHAHITSGSTLAVVTPSGETLGTVVAEIGQPELLDMEAPGDGVYGIAITSGRGKGRLRLELTNAVEDIHVVLGETCEPRMATHPGRLLVSRPSAPNE